MLKSKKKLRVLHLIDNLNSGGAQYVLNQMNAGLELCDQSVGYFFREVVDPKTYNDAGVKLYKFGKRSEPKGIASFFDWQIYSDLKRLIKSDTYDFIIVHLYAAPVFALFAKHYVPNSRWIYVLHATQEQLSWRDRCVLKIVLRSYDKIISQFHSTNHQLLKWGIPGKKVKFIPLGIDETKYNINFDSIKLLAKRDFFHINKEQSIILSIARLNAERFIETFILAMPFILSKVPNALLLLIGNGPQEEYLKSLAMSVAPNNIKFAGYQQDTKEVYACGNVYLSASINEDIGVSALKAMMCGLPVVAINIGKENSETPYMAATNEPGKVAEQIISLLNNTDLYNTYKYKALDYTTAHHQLKKSIQMYEELLKELSEYDS